MRTIYSFDEHTPEGRNLHQEDTSRPCRALDQHEFASFQAKATMLLAIPANVIKVTADVGLPLKGMFPFSSGFSCNVHNYYVLDSKTKSLEFTLPKRLT